MSGIGHIGELQIIDDLQKKYGFEIYLPLKDKGIDFIALKNEKSLKIQVKTSKFQKNSYYWFDLHKNKMIYNKDTFYIFVLFILPRRRMMGKNRNYLIIPSLELEKYIKKNEIASKASDKNILNIFIYPDFINKKWIYKNKRKEIDLTKFWNNFSSI